MPAVEMDGVSKTYRRRRTSTRRRRSTSSTSSWRPAACTASSGRTAPARRRRSACCSAWSPPTRFRRHPAARPAGAEGLPEVIGERRRAGRDPAVLPQLLRPAQPPAARRGRRGPATRVEECLELVDLRDRADDKFKGYSLGMKQRLGIAAALLKSPRLLILDEPSNGLDPAGIRDVRELIRRLGRDGQTTVLLSSHLLAEIQQVADSVTILARGRRVAPGPVPRCWPAARPRRRVRVPDPRRRGGAPRRGRLPRVPGRRRPARCTGSRPPARSPGSSPSTGTTWRSCAGARRPRDRVPRDHRGPGMSAARQQPAGSRDPARDPRTRQPAQGGVAPLPVPALLQVLLGLGVLGWLVAVVIALPELRRPRPTPTSPTPRQQIDQIVAEQRGLPAAVPGRPGELAGGARGDAESSAGRR